MNYVSKNNQSLFDVCLQLYGSLEFMSQLITDNSELSYDSQIGSGQEVVYSDSVGRKAIREQIVNNNLSLSNGANIQFVLGTQDDEFVTTDDGSYIEIEI